MGLAVTTDTFSPEDFARFAERLESNLSALAALLERPGFGEVPLSLGAELEMSLVAPDGRPASVAPRILNRLSDSRFTEEIDRFNLEYNSRPTAFSGAPLSTLDAEFRAALDRAQRVADDYDARLALIGILPTLTDSDLCRSVMTDAARYRALADGLRRQRHGPFAIRINGDEPFDATSEDVTYEGAATSVQLHLAVPPREFAPVYNAMQLATAPALALSGNSPTFLGHRLWDETRIVLFKHAVDARTEHDARPRIARVNFGQGWIRRSAYELFEQSVRFHAPLLPVSGNEVDSESIVRAGGVPALEELRLHHGTVWNWNRAVYDPHAGGHLRIELRAFPSGPTLIDMLATHAFVLGLGLDLAREHESWVERVPFDAVENDFYRAAQSGPDALLAFPDRNGSLVERRACELAVDLVERAERGLRSHGMHDAEIAKYLGVFARRAELGVTGARWQRETLRTLGYRLGDHEALHTMFREYHARMMEGAPVHSWKRV